MKTFNCITCGMVMTLEDNQTVLWDSLDCKKKFYLKYFNNQESKKWALETSEEFKNKLNLISKEIKDAGLTKEEFIKLLP